MAGRGRGRGRGQANQFSFDYSQLGFSGGEALPAPVLQPPPTFPTLEHKPIPLKSGPEMEYMVALKRHFIEYLHSIRHDNDYSSGIERFSDKYQFISTNVTEKWDSYIHWDVMPSELHPKEKRPSKRKNEKNIDSSAAKIVTIDISNRLDELAKLEDGEEREDSKESEEKEQEDDDDKENLEEEDEDEEMDDGTDYVNNYFDNGESYFDDEDDNLDDGPIY